MAGAYPKCTDCIPDPCLQPGYVDVIYADTRKRHYAGHTETLWTGVEINSYADLAADNGGVGREPLGQHTLDDFAGKEDDCDLIAYFWDNDTEELFAVERDRVTGIDGEELWRVAATSHPGFPCKSNNGYVVFLYKFATTPGGSSVNTTITWRNVLTGAQTHFYAGAGYWRWVTPLNEDEGIGVNAGATDFEAPLEGSALNIDELLPDDPPYATATNFLMGPGANFAGTVETDDGGDPPVITIDSGIWQHLPGSLIADAYTERLDEDLAGFVSQWCGKLYIVRNSAAEGVDRWPYSGASTFLGTEAVYEGGRAAYVVADTFPDGGDETEPGGCSCDGGNGGSNCDGCGCEGDFEIEVVSEPDPENPGCWLVTVECISAPCGTMDNFNWTIPTGDCDNVTYGPGFGWEAATCGVEFQVCGEYLVIRITDDCGCKATICVHLEDHQRTACECCNNVEPTQVSMTIGSITNQELATCPTCSAANGTYADAIEPTGAPGGCSWVLTGGACHLVAEDVCESTSNFLLYYTATLSITNCGSGAITITSTVAVQLFLSSDLNCSGTVVGGCNYQKVVVVDEVDQPANCLALINGTHTNTESCSAGSACILPDEIEVTWS